MILYAIVRINRTCVKKYINFFAFCLHLIRKVGRHEKDEFFQFDVVEFMPKSKAFFK